MMLKAGDLVMVKHSKPNWWGLGVMVPGETFQWSDLWRVQMLEGCKMIGGFYKHRNQVSLATEQERLKYRLLGVI